MGEWTLRDIDNRDDNGSPWETTATPADLRDGGLLGEASVATAREPNSPLIASLANFW